jgi:hypothetical protein
MKLIFMHILQFLTFIKKIELSLPNEKSIISIKRCFILLVGVLFYLHFSSKSKSATPQIIKTNGKSVTVPQIAYIDIDSFQNGYDYFKSGKKCFRSKAKSYGI